jgi:integrase/recombinase XerC
MQKFIKYLKFEKRYSEHTVKAYIKDLTQFYTYFSLSDNDEGLDIITARDIREWIVHLMKINSTRTVNRKLASLRTYYKYLMKNGQVSINPMEKVQSPKMTSRLPEFVPEKQMSLINTLFPNMESDFGEIRDYLMLEFLYTTGIRQTELIQMTHENIYKADSKIKVLGKRNKERYIPITRFLVDLINIYETVKISNHLQHKDNPFFVTDSGNKLYPAFVYRKVNYYLSQITSIQKKSPHILRHSFATHMLNHGADINALKDLLGHSSLAATQVYTHNSFEQLKKVYHEAHPRA